MLCQPNLQRSFPWHNCSLLTSLHDVGSQSPSRHYFVSIVLQKLCVKGKEPRSAIVALLKCKKLINRATIVSNHVCVFGRIISNMIQRNRTLSLTVRLLKTIRMQSSVVNRRSCLGITLLLRYAYLWYSERSVYLSFNLVVTRTYWFLFRS